MQRSFLAQWNQIQRKLAGLTNQVGDPHAASAWTPNADVYEGPEGLIVKIELAGVSLDALELRIEEQGLVVSGVRRDPQCGETASGYRFRQMEIEYGPFQRVIPLPFAVDGAAARAAFQQGMLIIRLPRSPTPRPTHIRIQLPT